MTLLEYSKTKHFQNMYNKWIREPEQVVCEICGREHYKIVKRGPHKGKKKVNVRFTLHHKTYENLWNEKREDMMIICYFCHTTFHQFYRIVSMVPDKLRHVYMDLMRETGWDFKRMTKEMQEELFAVPVEQRKKRILPIKRRKNEKN